MTRLRVLVVSLDHLSRAGLVAVLDQQPRLTVVGQVSGDEVPYLPLDVYSPEIIVWDVSWDTDSAIDNLGLLSENTAPVLALAATGTQAAQARTAGLSAVLSRDASPEALAAAIVALSHGLQVTDPALASDSVPGIPEPGSASLLTPREHDVLRLLAEGLPNKGVASRLAVSEHTVKFHVNSIMGKLNAQSRTEAVTLATRLGLLPI
ncbi:MAG: response regulator transcription factor [Chloroflexi bacterium]|nr:response regulator transcription factor [Chloroflexota bacterium]